MTEVTQYLKATASGLKMTDLYVDTGLGALAVNCPAGVGSFYVLGLQDSPVYVYHPGTIIDSILFTPAFSGWMIKYYDLPGKME